MDILPENFIPFHLLFQHGSSTLIEELIPKNLTIEISGYDNITIDLKFMDDIAYLMNTDADFNKFKELCISFLLQLELINNRFFETEGLVEVSEPMLYKLTKYINSGGNYKFVRPIDYLYYLLGIKPLFYFQKLLKNDKYEHFCGECGDNKTTVISGHIHDLAIPQCSECGYVLQFKKYE